MEGKLLRSSEENYRAIVRWLALYSGALLSSGGYCLVSSVVLSCFSCLPHLCLCNREENSNYCIVALPEREQPYHGCY